VVELEVVEMAAGQFRMGSCDGDSADFLTDGDGEGPARTVAVSAYAISACLLTNREFAAFADATGHVTDAERVGWSFVFAGLLPDNAPATRGVAGAEWWRAVAGADWRHPEGPGSDLYGRDGHPAVHLSWHDASAAAAHYGGRLPTEAEWERAARGGLEGARFPWGDELTPGGVHCCNIWQGEFPGRNTCEDGWYGTSPVGEYPPNGLGLYDVAGNVWEWCADWFDPAFHLAGSRVDPTGPPGGRVRVIRGGSYLCHESYCDRYRVAARSSNTPDSTTGNLGVRLAFSR